jgi:hypothetical protein
MVTGSPGSVLEVCLENLGLSHLDIPRLCPLRPRLSPEAVHDIIHTRSPGTWRSWEGIVAALNAFVGAETYRVEDLLGQPYECYLQQWLWQRGSTHNA